MVKIPPCETYEPPNHILYKRNNKELCRIKKNNNNPTNKLKSFIDIYNDNYLRPGQIGRLSPKISELFGEKFARFGVHAEGTCLFHAFLAAKLPEYRKLSIENMKKTIFILISHEFY